MNNQEPISQTIDKEVLGELLRQNSELNMKEDFYEKLEILLHSFSGLAIDQLELLYNLQNDSEKKSFDLAKRILLNKLNQETKPQIKLLLNNYFCLRITEEKVFHITFRKPTFASSKRSEEVN